MSRKQIRVNEINMNTPIDLTKEVETEPLKVHSGAELKLADNIERLEKIILGMKRVNNFFDVYRLPLFLQAHLLSKLHMLEIDKFNGTWCLRT